MKAYICKYKDKGKTYCVIIAAKTLEEAWQIFSTFKLSKDMEPQYETFVYKYKTPEGQVESGTIQAKNLKEAQKKFDDMKLDKGFTKLGVAKRDKDA